MDRPRLRPPRAILFDAGNTLIRMDYPAIAARLAELGVDVTPERIQRAEWSARVRLDADQFAALRQSTESRATHTRYVEYMLEGIGVDDASVVATMDAWRGAFNAPVGIFNTPEPTAAAALADARRAGLVTGVISNSNGTVAALLESLGLDADFVLDSHVVGIEKPDPRIFRLAIDRAGVSPAEAIYVGDLYSIDVLGARAAGLRAILIDPGACWGERDCPAVPDVAAAVRLLLDDRT